MGNNEVTMIECDKALSENKEYMELQRRCAAAYKCGDYELYSDLVCELQSRAEIICYMKGLAKRCTHFCTQNTMNNKR